MRSFVSVLLVVALVAPPGLAEEAAPDAGVESHQRPKLAPSLDLPTRQWVMDQQLELEFREASIWYFGWASFWSAITVSQVVQWPSDPSRRPAYFVWAISALAGTGLTWLVRPDVVATRPERLKVRDDPSLSPEERLRETERLWARAHDDETVQLAWWQQLITVVANVAPFLILGLGYREWNWGFLAFGLVVSELQCFTFPQLLHRFGLE